MSFVLRATLAIGALSYFALQRDQPGATVAIPEPMVTGATLAAAWTGLAPGLREQVMREGASRLVRGVGAPAPSALPNGAPSSRDTLVEADRRPVWRGSEAR